MDQPSLDRRSSETRSDGTRLDPSEVCPRGNTLSWSRLVVEKGKKVIIDNLQGEAKPAQLSAVMGHSGSGKTTLLRALAGRGAHTGEVFCDGEPINPSSFKFQNRIAFVADSEELEETATCFEAIQFSARLRLPSSFPDSQIDLVTTTLIEELRLGKCKDTQCRFLSAGEKRRVSLAVELVVRPAIVILDEPTSGLDSYNGMMMLECLRDLADRGCCVVLSIHHPNIQMFEKMHHVILIHEGRCLLRSNVDEIREFFDERGFPVPAEENPADWMLTVSQKYDIKALEEHGFFRDYCVADEGTPKSGPKVGSDALETESDISSTVSAEAELPKKDFGAAQIWIETRLLLRREWRRAIRDKVSAVSRFAVALTGGVLFGIVFLGVADNAIESSTDFLSHTGALFFFLFCGFMTAPDIALEFIDHRPIFEREFRTGHYHLVSHAIVNITREASIVLVMALLYFPVPFFAIGFQGRFSYMFLIFFTNAFSFVTQGVLIASAFRTPKLARDLLMIMTLPAGLFCGFYVNVSELPSWLQWLSWTTPLLYTLRLFLMEEFQFCAVPVGRDADLLACARGLEDFFNTGGQFTKDAVLTLAQTGIYRGPTSITEYARLLSASSEPEFSLLYDACTVSDNLELLVHSVSDSYCDVSTATILAGYISPLMALYPDQASESILGHRLKFAPPDEGTPALIDEDHVYWTNPKVESFGPFDIEKLSRNVCDTLQNVCSEKYFHFDNSTQCVDAMLSLPEGQWTSSGNYVYIGNSSICRSVHNFMAQDNPEAHCAHLSWPSQADPKGNFKCDDRILNNATFEFSREELGIFEQVSYKHSIRNVTQSRNVDPGDLGDCLTADGQAKLLLLDALDMKDEFENLDVSCYSYLQSNDATPDMQATYWIALLALNVAQRLLAGLLFRRNSLTRN